MSRSIRVGYGEHITKLGHKNKDLILLEADLADSTQSEPFQIAFPDRHFQICLSSNTFYIFHCIIFITQPNIAEFPLFLFKTKFIKNPTVITKTVT